MNMFCERQDYLFLFYLKGNEIVYVNYFNNNPHS